MSCSKDFARKPKVGEGQRAGTGDSKWAERDHGEIQGKKMLAERRQV